MAAASLHSSPCAKHEFLHNSSRCLCGANMCNTNSTQQMSACGLLTNTTWQWEKPEMEGDLAIRTMPNYQAAQLSAAGMPMLASPLNTAVTCIKHEHQKICKSAHGQVCHPALCKSRARNKVRSSNRPLMKHQRTKSARALSCAAATGMQGCNCSLFARPFEELQQRDTTLPDITTLSPMHTVLKVVCSWPTPYQQSLL